MIRCFLGTSRLSHLKQRGEDKNRTTPSSFLRARFQTCRAESGRPIRQTCPCGGKPRTGLGRKPAGQEGRQYYSLPPLKEGTNEPTTHATNERARPLRSRRSATTGLRGGESPRVRCEGERTGRGGDCLPWQARRGERKEGGSSEEAKRG